MIEVKPNNSSRILLFILMFFFFSFIHEEKERQVIGVVKQGTVNAVTTCSGLEAITVPAVSMPEKGPYLVNPDHIPFALVDCSSNHEYCFNKSISRFFNTYFLTYPPVKPFSGLAFLQKIPGQAKDDDLPSQP